MKYSEKQIEELRKEQDRLLEELSTIEDPIRYQINKIEEEIKNHCPHTKTNTNSRHTGFTNTTKYIEYCELCGEVLKQWTNCEKENK